MDGRRSVSTDAGDASWGETRRKEGDQEAYESGWMCKGGRVLKACRAALQLLPTHHHQVHIDLYCARQALRTVLQGEGTCTDRNGLRTFHLGAGSGIGSGRGTGLQLFLSALS